MARGLRLGAFGVALAFLAAGCGLAPSAAEMASSLNGAEGSKTSEVSDPAKLPKGISADLAEFYKQRLEWKDCVGAGFQCATLRVPLDYRKPGGRTIELALGRFRAQNPAQRKGSLVVNPGGPGGSGVAYVQNSQLVFGRSVQEVYDIVGMDPRGVGKSAPVDCVSDSELDEFIAADATPDSDQERSSLIARIERFSAGCEKRTGAEELQHLSTVEAARDMDILRSALGDSKLTYFGFSYGTFLGATYAELYPQRAGRLVLDGGIDPSNDEKEFGLGQARGFERAIKAFIADCVDRGQCPLGNTRSEAYDELKRFLDGLEDNPLPGNGDRKLGQALATSGVIFAMYRKDYWNDKLRPALDSALHGSGSELLALADLGSGREGDRYRDNAGEAILAVNCLDRPVASTLPQHVEEYRKASPLFGESIMWGSYPCAKWPVKSVGKRHKIKAEGAGPILVVGTTRDPATPFEWSHALADQLDDATLLIKDGDGHTGYGGNENPCIDTKVNTFLIEGQRPKDATRCAAQ